MQRRTFLQGIVAALAPVGIPFRFLARTPLGQKVAQKVHSWGPIGQTDRWRKLEPVLPEGWRAVAAAYGPERPPKWTPYVFLEGHPSALKADSISEAEVQTIQAEQDQNALPVMEMTRPLKLYDERRVDISDDEKYREAMTADISRTTGALEGLLRNDGPAAALSST